MRITRVDIIIMSKKHKADLEKYMYSKVHNIMYVLYSIYGTWYMREMGKCRHALLTISRLGRRVRVSEAEPSRYINM